MLEARPIRIRIYSSNFKHAIFNRTSVMIFYWTRLFLDFFLLKHLRPADCSLRGQLLHVACWLEGPLGYVCLSLPVPGSWLFNCFHTFFLENLCLLIFLVNWDNNQLGDIFIRTYLLLLNKRTKMRFLQCTSKWRRMCRFDQNLHNLARSGKNQGKW